MAIDGIGASFGGFQAINVSSSDTVLVTGLGPVGLGAIVNARFRNARVIGVEPMPWRAQRAREMGAIAVLDPTDNANILPQILDLTDGKGVDCAVDCSVNQRRKGYALTQLGVEDELPSWVKAEKT